MAVGLLTALMLCSVAIDTTPFVIGNSGVQMSDSVYVVECCYEHEAGWTERDTVEAKAMPRRSGNQWYVPLTSGLDVWCDKVKVLKRKPRS